MDTVTLGAVIGMAVFLILVAVLGYLQLSQIHNAVNSNMTSALNKIEELYGRITHLTEELDRKPRGRKPAKRKPTKRR